MDLKQTDKFTIEVPDAGMSASSDPNQTPQMGWSLDKGSTRQNNEDSLAAVTLNRASEAESQAIGVYAVADGMGVMAEVLKLAADEGAPVLGQRNVDHRAHITANEQVIVRR